MSSNDVAIRVKNLSKRYEIYAAPRDRLKQFVLPPLQGLFGVPGKQYFQEFWALKDVSFEVKKGETVGIIGRNGSGKSTLLQMICGTLFPTSGAVETTGRIAALLELGSGFNPEFTGRENVYLNGAVLGLGKEEIDSRFDEIAAFADIGEFIEQPVKTYSSGMFVRLAFAIQANVSPEILIIDEALAVGDAYFVHRCMLRFKELQESGSTILFVSHDANSVRNLCSRVIWLVDGCIKMEGDSTQVVDAYLAHLFRRQVVTEDLTASESLDIAENNQISNFELETSIPNIDRRLGDQKCTVIGVGLYNESMTRISSTLNDNIVILRVTVQNHSIGDDTEMAVGYIFRNAKGQEIASTNNQIEKVTIKPIANGGYFTVHMKIKIPFLHPGSYAFTVTAGYIDFNREIKLSDRIENAIAFNVVSDKRVHVMMNFPTCIEVKGANYV